MMFSTMVTPVPPTPRPPRSRLGRVGVVTSAALLALTGLAACGGGDDDPPPGGAEYVALGDSDAAGAGIAPLGDSVCLRSKVNYPSLVAKKLDYGSFEDVTCAGAQTTDLLRPQLAKAGSNDPQLDAVGTRTKLVTLTIGLNDQQVAFGLLRACLQPNDQTPLCHRLINAKQAIVDAQLHEAAARVEDSLRLIRTKAPDARIILV